MKFAVVISTGGSVLNAVLAVDEFRKRIAYVVSDRQCVGIEAAKLHKIPTVIISGSGFSDNLERFALDNGIDYIISFYTRLFKGRLLQTYSNRIINLHPSILPSFKGLHGFDDGWESQSLFLGSTIHFIDESMDEGIYIIQAAAPRPNDISYDLMRHKVFIQQCKCLLQVVHWIYAGRVVVDGGRTRVSGATYLAGEYSPNLDWDMARDFNADYKPSA